PGVIERDPDDERADPVPDGNPGKRRAQVSVVTVIDAEYRGRDDDPGGVQRVERTGAERTGHHGGRDDPEERQEVRGGGVGRAGRGTRGFAGTGTGAGEEVPAADRDDDRERDRR